MVVDAVPDLRADLEAVVVVVVVFVFVHLGRRVEKAAVAAAAVAFETSFTSTPLGDSLASGMQTQ